VFEDGFLIHSNVLITSKDETKKNEENKPNVKLNNLNNLQFSINSNFTFINKKISKINQNKNQILSKKFDDNIDSFHKTLHKIYTDMNTLMKEIISFILLKNLKKITKTIMETNSFIMKEEFMIMTTLTTEITFHQTSKILIIKTYVTQ